MVTFDNPLGNNDPELVAYATKISNAITFIFVAEFLIKATVYGLVLNGPDSYMRNGWNIFDFIIVVISIVSFFAELKAEEDSYLRENLDILKILRVLRSLRILSRNEGLRFCVLGLIYSFPGIIRATIAVFLVCSLLSLFFVSLLRGQFYFCQLPPAVEDILIRQPLKTKFDCLNYGGLWKNQNINFDDLPNALLALLAMVTNEGWVEFMFNAVDSAEIGYLPVTNNRPIFQAVFIIYMIFGSIFITHLFIEVVIATYDSQRKVIDGDSNLTEFQQEFI